jgi:RNA polymerase sigma-70 factor (ECF subfamily)
VLARALETIHRRDGGRILAGLIGKLGSIQLAEEALQDAFAAALERWPVDGVPSNPAGWLTTVARRRGLDRLRYERRRPRADGEVWAELADPGADDSAEALDLPDERLRLIFTCCHPAIAPASQVALALHTLCGLTTREIARAFVEPEATTAQKLVRAKRKIASAGIPYEVPSPDALPARLAAVLAVVYLLFNEGYTAAAGETLVRPDLCAEALRLARAVSELMPDRAEAHGLLALLLFHDARRAARLDATGALVPLEEQDRRLWSRPLIEEGAALLRSAIAQREPGPYQLQAAVAALHAEAASAADTDWVQISALYARLLRLQPSPIVELNAAVAYAMAFSLDEGLRWIETIEARGIIEEYHLLHAARADLLRRQGRREAARGCYLKAIERTANLAERRYLQGRIAALTA